MTESFEIRALATSKTGNKINGVVTCGHQMMKCILMFNCLFFFRLAKFVSLRTQTLTGSEMFSTDGMEMTLDFPAAAIRDDMVELRLWFKKSPSQNPGYPR
jgi:hypothetical protein